MASATRRATKWVARKAVAIVTPGVCGCFTASTVVWTSTGLVPIANVAKGDQVIAYNESTGQIDLRAVTDTIEIPGAMLLRIVLQHGDGHLETIETTDEHPFLVVGRVTLDKAWKQAWSRADQLRPGDTLTTLTGTASVLSLHFTSERQTVHNLTVEGLATYHVGPDGVVVHNCGYVDALGSHVVDVAHHNWDRMFGRKPSLDEVRQLVLDTATSGTLVQESLHKAGLRHRFERVVNGFTLWADVFLDEATNTLRVINGGIK